MGYYTSFSGEFSIHPPPTQEQRLRLDELRELTEETPGDREFFESVEFTPCRWELDEEEKKLVCPQEEVYNFLMTAGEYAGEWLKYLAANLFKVLSFLFLCSQGVFPHERL